MMPITVPMSPLRMMVRQYFVISASLGITLSCGFLAISVGGFFMTVSTSARPKAPTMAGMRAKPPMSSVVP